MRIIRPQQLILLKNGYQIGRDCRMGISVVAGCYLSRPAHFVTEPQIWQAWKAAPLCFRLPDAAEPKPCAEFLLAGHAGTGEPVTALDVSARVGPLSRRWRLQGESSQDGGSITPFMRMPLDHPLCRGGTGCKENPLGRGVGDNHRPLVISADASGLSHSALVAPTPVPPGFHLRKKHLDKVARHMRDRHYLENVFPGFPATLDPRYFQMALPAQWLQAAEWPDEIPFELVGFRPHHAVLTGCFPAVRARAFIWQHQATAPEEVPLLRKTLWLLPDDDIGLLVFTGAITLEHLFAEPVETLLIALDAVQAMRDENHYRQVYARRHSTQAAPFEFLNDPDLMPQDMALNVIRDLSDHPDSCRYSAAPLSQTETAQFYQEIRSASAVQQQLQQAREMQTTAAQAAFSGTLPPSDPVDQGGGWLHTGEDVAENMTFTATDFAGRELRDKCFRFCIFERCNFDRSSFTDCRFDYCQFRHTSHRHSLLTDVHITDSFFQHSRWQNAQLTRCAWVKVTLENADLRSSSLTECCWRHGIINQSDFSAGLFQRCLIKHCCFSATALTQSQHRQGQFDSCLFGQCMAQQSVFTDSQLSKSSLTGGDWHNCGFIRCTLESVTTGLNIDLSASRYEQCQMEKIGFYQARLQGSRFIHSRLLEGCCDKANLSQIRVSACDMPGLRLREATLIQAFWSASSLQQGMLYNADLRDATFNACNLAGACLAMVRLSATSRFDRCLMEKAQWLPRRRQTPVLPLTLTGKRE